MEGGSALTGACCRLSFYVDLFPACLEGCLAQPTVCQQHGFFLAKRRDAEHVVPDASGKEVQQAPTSPTGMLCASLVHATLRSTHALLLKHRTLLRKLRQLQQQQNLPLKPRSQTSLVLGQKSTLSSSS